MDKKEMNYRSGQPRVLAVHDICGVGKCSLTAAIPILSAVGIEACPMPTAVFSNHTAFSSFVYEDLSPFLMRMAEGLKSEGFHFDAVYTGYLASAEQAQLISDIITLLAEKDTRIIVDPAMADNGKLYTCFSDAFPTEMKKLCRRASVITPNITEALLLLGRNATVFPKTRGEYEEVLSTLAAELGCDVVLTSVLLEDGEIACAVSEGGRISFHSGPYVSKGFHGTGDIFSSVLTAAILGGRSLTDSTRIAATFVHDVIKDTAEHHPNLWYGVNFEKHLAALASTLA